jgi:hypothetical protein
MTCCPEGRDDDKVALLKSLTDAELMAYVDGVLDAHALGEQEMPGEWYQTGHHPTSHGTRTGAGRSSP